MGLLDDAIREHLDLKRARGADPTEIERLEREALGPVRRERAIGGSHFDAPEQHDPGRTRGEQATEYHDSTAPHANHDHAAPPLNLAGAHAHGDPVQEEDAPHRRRGFLRRSRPASPDRPVETTHNDPESSEGAVHFAPVHDEPLAHDYERLLHHDAPAHEQPPVHEELPVQPPPALAFEAPPERPRFTPEPPTASETVDVTEEEPEVVDGVLMPDEVPSQQEARAPRHDQPVPHDDEPLPHGSQAPPHGPQPHGDDPGEHHHEPQPTREFDALAESEPEEEEDVLEETPEFLQDTPEHDRLWFEQRPPRDFDFDG